MNDDFDDAPQMRRIIAELHERMAKMNEQHFDAMSAMIARAGIMASWISGRHEQNDDAVAAAVSLQLGDTTWRKTANRMNPSGMTHELRMSRISALRAEICELEREIGGAT